MGKRQITVYLMPFVAIAVQALNTLLDIPTRRRFSLRAFFADKAAHAGANRGLFVYPRGPPARTAI